MKINLLNGEIDFSIEEIADVITRIGNHINGEKNALCVNLEIINMSLKDWYDEMSDKYQEWITNGMKPDSQEIKFILNCIMNADRRDITEKSAAFLYHLDELYRNGELKESLSEKLDIEKINQVRTSLNNFSKVTTDAKLDWVNRARQNQPFPLNDILDWFSELDGYRKTVNESISLTTRNLDCQPISKEELEQFRTM